MRILLVEGDESISKLVASVLTKQGYIVDIASDGLAGWNFIEAFDYDMILLDTLLAKLNGIQLCQKLRQAGYHIPVLMLTSRGTLLDKVRGLDAGADDYLVKPFEMQELEARMRALLRRRSSLVPPVLEWGCLQLDPNTCEVTYKDKSLYLTQKEYGLLNLFLCNHRRVFSRSAIVDKLWIGDDPPEEDTIKSHIKGLRQKLKAAGAAADLIETVYGVGYRLKPLSKEERSKTVPWILKQVDGTEGLVKALNSPSDLPIKAASSTNLIQALDQLFALATANEQPLYLAILRLTNFQDLVEKYGHSMTDKVTQHLGQLLRKMFRNSDVVASGNNGEFVIGMYGMLKPKGIERLEKVLKVLQSEQFCEPQGGLFNAKFSAGAAAHPDDGNEIKALYEVAFNTFAKCSEKEESNCYLIRGQLIEPCLDYVS